jgi:hypothetical protein
VRLSGASHREPLEQPELLAQRRVLPWPALPKPAEWPSSAQPSVLLEWTSVQASMLPERQSALPAWQSARGRPDATVARRVLRREASKSEVSFEWMALLSGVRQGGRLLAARPVFRRELPAAESSLCRQVAAAVVYGCLLAACRSPRREAAALKCPSAGFAARVPQLAASVASAQQAVLPSAALAERHARVAAAVAAGQRAAAALQPEAARVAVVVLPQAAAGAVRVAAVVLPPEAVEAARAGAAVLRQAAGVPGAPVRRRAALPSAVPWVFRRDQPPPWPARSPAVLLSARAMEELRTALPSARWRQAVQGEVLS